MEPAQTDKARNPYSPPAAAVADVATASRPMPSAVRRALILYTVSFLLGLVMMLIDRPAEGDAYAEASAIGYVVSLAVLILIGAWLFLKISAGRNWARIVLLVLTLLSLPFSFMELVEIAPDRPFIAGLKLIEVGMDIGVLFLLFFPGREFFKALPR